MAHSVHTRGKKYMLLFIVSPLCNEIAQQFKENTNISMTVQLKLSHISSATYNIHACVTKRVKQSNKKTKHVTLANSG